MLQVTAYLGAGARQFGFMLRGLRELEGQLKKLGIPFFMLQGDPTETIPKLVKDTGAAALVTDFGPLRLGRQWRQEVVGMSRMQQILLVHPISSLRLMQAQTDAGAPKACSLLPSMSSPLQGPSCYDQACLHIAREIGPCI